MDGRVARAQKQRESRRAALLSVARRIFSQKGYHSTSIDDLIEAAGVARGTFYLYFESKRAIFEELLDGLFATLASTVHRIDVSPGAPPPIDQVTAIVERIFATLDENRELARILLREAVGLDEDFDRKLADFYGRIERMIESALRTGITLGVVRPLDPEIVSRCILGAVKEIVHQTYVVQATTASKATPTRLIGREVIAFTLRGVFA
jgi:AcrR family transcriptional regulator